MNDIEMAIEHCKQVIENLPCGEYKQQHEFLLLVLQEKLQREENKALTLEELKLMEGKPAYIKAIPPYDYGEYKVILKVTDDQINFTDSSGYYFIGYGKTWLTYRNEVISVGVESEG